MNLNQIRYFLAVVDEGTFTRAATRCGISQPSLTNAIKALELRLGHSLFDRGLHGATLTTRGELLRPHLEHILKSVDELFLISNQDVRAPNSHAEIISPREPRSRFKRRHGDGSIEQFHRD